MSELSTFLDAIGKLPPAGGIVYRGLTTPAEDLPPLGVLAGVVATSRDPRVATENFTAPGVLVLLTRTGRDLSALSAHPEEAEVVQRPGTVWSRLLVPGLPPLVGPSGEIPVLVLEELDPSGAAPAVDWPDTLAELATVIGDAIRAAAGRPVVDVPRPGMFAGEWPAQPVER